MKKYKVWKIDMVEETYDPIIVEAKNKEQAKEMCKEAILEDDLVGRYNLMKVKYRVEEV